MKSLIMFLLGGVVGAAVGAYGMKLYLQDKEHARADEEIEEMRKYYENLMDDVVTSKDEEENVPEPQHFKKGLPDEEESRESSTQKVNYQGFYLDPAETEYPEEDQYPDEEGDDFVEDMISFHERNKGRDPRIISVEAAGDLPANIDHQILYYYKYDETITDEAGLPIEDYERLIGGCLYKYDFVDNDERILFVLNYDLDTLYEIEKLDEAWHDIRDEEGYE